MNKNIKARLKKYIPPHINRLRLEYNILRDYKLHKLDGYLEEIEYIRNHKSKFMPYVFTEKYAGKIQESGYDFQKKLPFILHNQKKLYFPKNMKLKKMTKIYNGLCTEQDEESPHKYFEKELEHMNLEECIFVDCGAAEGIISLDFVEKVRKIYIVECSKKWRAPLEATFEPWKEKVFIIEKFVGNENSKTTCTLDELLKKETLNIIVKMDIEGYELSALEGARKTLANNNLKTLLSICTYHKKDDYVMICKILEEYGYSISASNGFVLWNFKKILDYPYFRKCLVRAYKTEESVKIYGKS